MRKFALFKFFLLASILLIAAFKIHRTMEYRAMHLIPPGLKEFGILDPLPVCGRWKEHMPKVRNAEIYRPYIKARKLWRSKIEWELSRQEAQGILDDVKFAADNGDWGARAVLAQFYRTGLGPLPDNHVLDADTEKTVVLARMAVEAGQPWGFFTMGHAHEYGYGGVVLDEHIAWAYYLRAAELGSPDAQMALADAYSNARLPDKGKAMLICAFQQGHGAAAYQLGLIEEVSEHAARAVSYYQEGTKFGSKDCAAALQLLFSPTNFGTQQDEREKTLRSIGGEIDSERSKRYEEFFSALEINPDLRFVKLDEVLPLPPKKLPPWHTIDDAMEPESDAVPTY
jgi:hypothetical protein